MPVSEKKKNNSVLWFIIKVVVTISAIAWFATSVDWRNVYDNIGKLDITMLLFAFIVYLFRLAPCSLRWKKVGATCGYHLSFYESFYGYMIGGFFNTFMPTGRGGDAARAFVVSRKHKMSFGGLMGTIFVERFIGLVVTVLIALAAVLAASAKIKALNEALPSIIILSVLLIVLGLVFISPFFQKLYDLITPKLPFQKLWKGIAKMLEVFYVYREKPADLTWVVIYSLFNQIIFITSGFLAAKAIFGFTAPWYAFPIVIPLIFVAELIPSVGGYGIREAGYVMFFGWFGVSSEVAVVYGIMQLLFIWVSALMGAVFFVAGSPSSRQDLKNIRSVKA